MTVLEQLEQTNAMVTVSVGGETTTLKRTGGEFTEAGRALLESLRDGERMDALEAAGYYEGGHLIMLIRDDERSYRGTADATAAADWAKSLVPVLPDVDGMVLARVVDELVERGIDIRDLLKQARKSGQ